MLPRFRTFYLMNLYKASRPRQLLVRESKIEVAPVRGPRISPTFKKSLKSHESRGITLSVAGCACRM